MERLNGLQGGDLAELARAQVQLVGAEEPPLRWVAGADAVKAVKEKANTRLAQADARGDLSSNLDHDARPVCCCR